MSGGQSKMGLFGRILLWFSFKKSEKQNPNIPEQNAGLLRGFSLSLIYFIYFFYYDILRFLNWNKLWTAGKKLVMLDWVDAISLYHWSLLFVFKINQAFFKFLLFLYTHASRDRSNISSWRLNVTRRKQKENSYTTQF